MSKARDRRVTISNGAFMGQNPISGALAISLVEQGFARVTDPVACVIALTFADYDSIVSGERPAAMERLWPDAVDGRIPVPVPHKLKMRNGQARETFKDSNPGVALASHYQELVYAGRKAEGSPVTGKTRVLRKLQRGRLINWSETEGFRARRFNPDQLPAPLYRTVSEMEQFRHAPPGT